MQTACACHSWAALNSLPGPRLRSQTAQVVSLPTADERKRLEQQGQPVVERPYTEKVRAAACMACVPPCKQGRTQ
jgi:hypothetical protein